MFARRPYKLLGVRHSTKTQTSSKSPFSASQTNKRKCYRHPCAPKELKREEGYRRRNKSFFSVRKIHWHGPDLHHLIGALLGKNTLGIRQDRSLLPSPLVGANNRCTSRGKFYFGRKVSGRHHRNTDGKKVLSTRACWFVTTTTTLLFRSLDASPTCYKGETPHIIKFKARFE